MAVRDWSGGRIAVLWLAWVCLIALAAWSGRANRPGVPLIPHQALSFSPSSEPQDLSDSQAVVLYSILSPLPTDGRPDTSRQAALLRLLGDSVPAVRDSLWHALGLPAKLTTVQRDSLPALVLAPIGKALSISGSDQLAGAGLWLWLIGVGTLAVGLPVILGIITLRWYVPRVIAKAAQGRAV